MKYYIPYLFIILLSLSQAQIFSIPLIYSNIKSNSYVQKLRSLASNRNLIQSDDSSYYYASIYLGKNKMNSFNVFFDTTFSFSWIPSSFCSKDLCQGFKNTYSCVSSDLCQLDEKKATFKYQDGQLSGQYAKADLHVSDMESQDYQIFSAAQIQNLQNMQVDGVIGMQIYKSSNSNQESFISMLQYEGKIQIPMFSFYLQNNGENDSKITFGGFDPITIKNIEKLNYHNLLLNEQSDQIQQWALGGNQLQIGSYSVDLVAKQNKILVSSVDEKIGLSKDIFDDMMSYLTREYNAFQRDGKYFINCQQQIPSILVEIPDSDNEVIMYDLTPNYFINNKTSTCQLMIKQIQNSDAKIILGTPFLQKYVSIFTITNSTIGFAESAQNHRKHETFFDQASYVIVTICCSILILLIATCLYKQWQISKSQLKNNLIEPEYKKSKESDFSTQPSINHIQATQNQSKVKAKNQEGIVCSSQLKNENQIQIVQYNCQDQL